MKRCLVIADPVAWSMSPVMHNAAYAALGLEGDYIFEARRVAAGDLANFVAELRSADDIYGVSCSMPHKQALLPLLDEVDEVARKIGAVNTIVRQEDGSLVGYNTDWTGAMKALEAVGPVRGKAVAVMGAGGAAKALVYGLTRAGAQVVVYNRTASKAEDLAGQFGCDFETLDEAAIRRADIVCNTTKVGMGDPGASPVPAEYLHAHQVVFDAVTHPYETKLLRDAKAAGATVIHGAEMLLYQGAAQFKLFTGLDAPEEAMRAALRNEIRRREARNE